MNSANIYSYIDDYIAAQPVEVIPLLNRMRNIIRKAAPQATEVIRYGMPAYKLQKVLVYFAAHKKHIGFYPTAEPMQAFAKELLPYKTSKGAIQFPFDQEIPEKLITEIVKFRLDKDEKLFLAKTKKQ